MRVLAIENSCDETAVAIIENDKLIHQELASQIAVHNLFGGVVPEIASREHLRILPLLYTKALEKTGLKLEDFDAIAVARGPGLLGSLLVGVAFAKGLSFRSQIPLIGVNHLEAHLLAAGLEQEIEYPCIGLLVSGGHTHIYRIENPFNFKLLGRSIDDAAGEIFDKIGKSLNFPYPSGKYINLLAEDEIVQERIFPLAFVKNDNLDFSFSGLKTAVMQYIAKNPEAYSEKLLTEEEIYLIKNCENTSNFKNRLLKNICAALNETVAEILAIKVERALKREDGIKSIILAGGVAANSIIRKRIEKLAFDNGKNIHLPSLDLCTDNAAMIGYIASLLRKAGYYHDLHLDAVPRGQQIVFDYLQENI